MVMIVFLWYSYSNEVFVILLSKFDIHFQLVVEAINKKKIILKKKFFSPMFIILYYCYSNEFLLLQVENLSPVHLSKKEK